ncbi:MAG: small ribosomal subunit biogenesis GTPase RsgA [Pseudomonadota bacterium]
MAQRRLTDQQRARIAQIQDQRRRRASEEAENALSSADDEAHQGVVIIRHGRNLVVADDTQHLTPCLFRQNLGQIVCGDRVIWHQTGNNEGVVTALQPRSTLLSRPDYGGREKALAANLSQLVIVAAPEPPPTGYLLDQYFVAAENIGLDAVLLLNKSDLLTADHPLRQIAAVYRRIGYQVIEVSSKQMSGMSALRQQLQHQTSMLVGQSGVGKSSLVNALLPEQNIVVGQLSETSGLGRHTTSSATLYFLPQGGSLIDSAGVRSFRLMITGRQQLEKGFREFHDYLGRCQFSDCSHQHEPGCALIEAVAEGSISPWRLQHFVQMAKSLEKGSRK